MKIPKRITWFLIADSAKARLIESSGPKGDWRTIGEWSDETARAPSRELERDRPPRGRTIGTGEPFAIEGRSEHDKAGEAFLSARAQGLEDAAKQDRFDQLVVAAPPAALGFLRKKLAQVVSDKIVGSFDKDLTNEAERDLYAYFLAKLGGW